MTGSRFSRPLDELEKETHVAREDQVESQDTDPPPEYESPDAYDLRRRLTDPGYAGRLHPER